MLHPAKDPPLPPEPTHPTLTLSGTGTEGDEIGLGAVNTCAASHCTLHDPSQAAEQFCESNCVGDPVPHGAA